MSLHLFDVDTIEKSSKFTWYYITDRNHSISSLGKSWILIVSQDDGHKNIHFIDLITFEFFSNWVEHKSTLHNSLLWKSPWICFLANVLGHQPERRYFQRTVWGDNRDCAAGLGNKERNNNEKVTCDLRLLSVSDILAIGPISFFFFF